MDFRYSETWTTDAHEKGFSISIKRWAPEGQPDVNKWNVYALVYKKHPLYLSLRPFCETFEIFEISKILPFNWYCSYAAIKYDDVLEIGSDYQHLHDDFVRVTNLHDYSAKKIRLDAQYLYNVLKQSFDYYQLLFRTF